jgi:hypothetical protein
MDNLGRALGRALVALVVVVLLLCSALVGIGIAWLLKS